MKEFDAQFQKLYTEMVELAFEFVSNNKSEVDTIYVYGSMEEGHAFYNVFYTINGQLVKLHKVNSVSTMQYDLSDKRAFEFLKLGNNLLHAAAKLFREDNREIPTLMKLTYQPKTGAFNNKMSYDLQYSNHPDKTNVDGFQAWFEETKKSKSA